LSPNPRFFFRSSRNPTVVPFARLYVRRDTR
jgi:hypothetical protein